MVSGSGNFAASRTDAGDQVGCCLDADPDLNQVLQRAQLRRENHFRQLEMMAVADADNQTDSDDSDAALPIPPFLSSFSKSMHNVTNLDSFLNSVTPIVPAQKPSTEVNSNGQVSNEPDIHPYYCIGDLWETFQEWSAYGAGVPFLLYDEHPTTQYYVPYLSGMQLYTDPKKVGSFPAKENDPEQWSSSVSNGSFETLNLTHQQLKRVMLRDNKTEVCGSRGTLAFEFMEQERPHTRKSLADKASVLVTQFPELSNYRSCDLSPSSWICVAWYPIYRIPMGPTLQDLEASFLTLHSLSTQPGSYNESQFSSRYGNGVHGATDLSSRVRLPVIGLVSYKLKGSIISPCDPQEREQENALLEAAENWLHNLQALLPDYQFFLKRY